MPRFTLWLLAKARIKSIDPKGHKSGFINASISDTVRSDLIPMNRSLQPALQVV
jgi:hypothetical protein